MTPEEQKFMTDLVNENAALKTQLAEATRPSVFERFMSIAVGPDWQTTVIGYVGGSAISIAAYLHGTTDPTLWGIIAVAFAAHGRVTGHGAK